MQIFQGRFGKRRYPDVAPEIPPGGLKPALLSQARSLRSRLVLIADLEESAFESGCNGFCPIRDAELEQDGFHMRLGCVFRHA